MHESVTEESIQKANAQFWEQMLAMQLEPIGTTGERCIGTQHVMGSCDLSGAWNGRIEVRLACGLALEATAAMVAQPAENVQPEDMLDAAKEIANMIAGTIKSALPRPCIMSVPAAEAEPANFCVMPRTHESVSVFFRHPSGELIVHVWEQVPETERDSKTLEHGELAFAN